MNKKVLYISPNATIGGAETFILHACEGHFKLGHWHPLVLFLNSGPLIERSELVGATSYSLPFKLRFFNLISFFKTILFIRNLIKKEQVRMVHATMPYAHILSFFATLGLRIPITWFQHGPVGGKFDFIAKFLPTNHLFFNSSFLRIQHYREFRIESKENTTIIPLAVKMKHRDDLPLDYQQLKDEFVITCAGRISDIKGYDLVISALAKLKAEQELDGIKLIIVGDAIRAHEKAYLTALKQQVSRERIEDSVFFINSKLVSLSTFFDISDIFILPTKIPEAFGLVAAEAMLQKVLVIGSNYGGVEEIITNETAFPFDSRSPEAAETLKQLILKIYQESKSQGKSVAEVYKQKIQKGHQLISTNHNLKNMTRCLERVYDQLLS